MNDLTEQDIADRWWADLDQNEQWQRHMQLRDELKHIRQELEHEGIRTDCRQISGKDGL